MRTGDIRFKAKSLTDGSWVEGDLLHRVTDTCIAVKDMDDIVYYPVDPSTVCQYTGLKDKEGKEIWEGDLIKNEYTKTIYEVVYSLRKSCYEAISTKDRDSLPLPIGWFVHHHNVVVLHSKFGKEVKV